MNATPYPVGSQVKFCAEETGTYVVTDIDGETRKLKDFHFGCFRWGHTDDLEYAPECAFYTGLKDELGDEIVIVPHENFLGVQGWMVCEEANDPNRPSRRHIRSPKFWCCSLAGAQESAAKAFKDTHTYEGNRGVRQIRGE